MNDVGIQCYESIRLLLLALVQYHEPLLTYMFIRRSCCWSIHDLLLLRVRVITTWTSNI